MALRRSTTGTRWRKHAVTARSAAAWLAGRRPSRLLAAGIAFELLWTWAASHVDVTRVPGTFAPTAALVAVLLAFLDLWVGVAVALVGGVAFTVMVSYGSLGGPDPRFYGLGAILTWTVAAFAAGLLGRVWRTRAQRAVAEAVTLHREFVGSLASPRRIAVPELAIVTRYVPGERLLELGGDFLDVVRVEGGIGLLIGDVSGHGAAAAAVGAMLRAAWEGTVAGGVSDERRIAALNKLLLDRAPNPEFFATLCSVLVSPEHHTARVIVAGHPPPVLLADGTARLLDVPAGPPLGVGVATPWASTTVPLPDGFALLLYTDGVVEGRTAAGSSARFGTGRLLELCLEQGPGDTLPDRVLLEAQQANGGPLPDDAALLLARVQPAPVPVPVTRA